MALDLRLVTEGGCRKSEFVDARSARQVVADDLAQNLVDLALLGLGAQRPAELGLDHGEGRFDVRPLVVVGRKVSRL